METGIDYPTIELGGKTYQVKFNRALLYQLDKRGIAFNPQFRNGGATCGLAAIIDTMQLAIGFEGTADELAELVYDKRDEALTALVAGWGKVVLPSLQAKLAATVAKPTAAEALPPEDRPN